MATAVSGFVLSVVRKDTLLLWLLETAWLKRGVQPAIAAMHMHGRQARHADMSISALY